MATRFFPHRGHRPRSRPVLEVLEGRDCPAVTATLADGVLTVVGDASPNQVGVVELGGGVVKINADGEHFPLFAGVESIVIETLGGADSVWCDLSTPVGLSPMGNRDLVIDLGAGDDVVIVRDHEPDPAPAAGMQLFFQGKLSLGTGQDFVRVEVNQGTDASVDVLSADGGDDIGVAMGVPGRQKWSPIELKRGKVTMDLGAGDNRVSVATSNVDEVEVNVKTSGRAGAAPDGPGDRFALTFANQGVGDLQQWLFFSKMRLDVNSGGTDDWVAIDSRGFADVSTDIDTGGGNDTVVARYRMVNAWPTKAPASLDFAARLGDGDDCLKTHVRAFSDVSLAFDLGAGDDRANVRIGSWITDVSYERSVTVVGHLNSGSDSLNLATRGYTEVRADLDTGPDGDGQDEVAATFVLPGESGTGRRNLVTLHSCDLDRFEVLGIGYTRGDITLTGQQCLVHLLGGTP